MLGSAPRDSGMSINRFCGVNTTYLHVFGVRCAKLE